MSEIINWLNNNAGAMNAILTAVYVIATTFIIIYSHKTVREMKISRKQEIKPQITMSFETRRGGLICLVLKNLGKSAAENLNIIFSKKWLDNLSDNKKTKIKKLRNASIIIVPGQEMIFTLGGPSDFDKLTKEKLNIEIEYRNIFEEKETKEFTFDFESYSSLLIYGPQIDELTTTIKQKLKDINKNLKKLQ